MSKTENKFVNVLIKRHECKNYTDCLLYNIEVAQKRYNYRKEKLISLTRSLKNKEDLEILCQNQNTRML